MVMYRYDVIYSYLWVIVRVSCLTIVRNLAEMSASVPNYSGIHVNI